MPIRGPARETAGKMKPKIMQCAVRSSSSCYVVNCFPRWSPPFPRPARSIVGGPTLSAWISLVRVVVGGGLPCAVGFRGIA